MIAHLLLRFATVVCPLEELDRDSHVGRGPEVTIGTATRRSHTH